MNVVAAGIYRSGSTWLFNALRLILESDGNTYSVWCDSYKTPGPYKHQLVKIHRFKPNWARWGDRIFTSWRDHDEILASMRRRKERDPENEFSKETATGRMPEYMVHLLHWQMWANEWIYYPDLVKKPVASIQKLSEALEIPVDAVQINNQLSLLKPPDKWYDPKTLLHQDHFTSR